MRDLFLRAARGEPTERPPVWVMRQAGRYLPEYRRIRAEHSFIEAITTPEVAERISLLPWERFRPDGVVMYSDIMIAIEPLGFSYRLESGVGPVVENPVAGPADVDLDRGDVRVDLDYVGELLRRLSERLGDRAAVIGFVGGPFTLAAYVVEGRPSRDFTAVRRFRATHPESFRTLLDRITDVLVDVVEYQIDNGADVIQLFDTYAGLLSPEDYREFVVPLHRRIVEAATVPTIVFARGMGGRLDLLADSGADVVSLDWTVDMAEARRELGETAVQGNLDPSTLYGPPAFVRERTLEVVEAAGDAGHVLNLGHGVYKDTPVEGVRTFVETAKSIDR